MHQTRLGVAAITVACGLAIGVSPASAQTLTPSGPDFTVGDNMNSGTSGAANIAIGRVSAAGTAWSYGIGTVSCNPNTYVDPISGQIVNNPAPMPAIWDDDTGPRKPVIAQNMFRYSPATGRLEQVGYSWLKHAFLALQQTLCNSGCQATGGSSLGINCSDPYTASRNAGSGSPASLGPRYEVNPFTGRHSQPFITTTTLAPVVDTTSRRLRVDNAPTELFVAGATYYVDTIYIGPDDSAFGNSFNNASYRRINSIDLPTAAAPGTLRFTNPTVRMLPAIYAWREATGGASSPVIVERVGLGGVYPARTSGWSTLTALTITNQAAAGYFPPLPIGDGYLFVGSNAINLNNGTWRYEYAVYNLTSERSAGAFRVPVPAGANVSNISIRQVQAHSGNAAQDARRNAAWSSGRVGNEVVWASQTPYDAAQPLVNNHIEWGTMWNFSFVADVAPVTRGEATIGFYKPATAAGQPGSLASRVWAPDPDFTPACYANCDGSTAAPTLNALDFSCFLTRYQSAQSLAPAAQVGDYANCDGSTSAPVLNALDFGCFLNRYQQGCR